MAVKGRIKGGSTFRISLGEYTLRPIDDWRAKARAIMARARDGVDPRVQSSDDQTFAEARDRYLGSPPPVSRGAKTGQPWSDAYLRDTTRYLTHNVDELEKLKLRHITGAHMLAAISSMKSTSLRRAAYASLSAFFSWCVQQRLIEASPVLSLKPPPAAASRERELTRKELTAVMLATGEMGYPFGNLYRLMLLTGKRKGEVAKIRWQDIDLDAEEWTIQSSQTKSGNALVEPLSRQAVELLRDCPRFGDYAFTTNGRSSVSGFSRAESRLYALSGNEGDESWRVHDFRRSLVSTAAREFGTPIAVADRHLNHAGGARGIARVYQRYDLLRERKQLAQQWADWLYNTENVGRLNSA